MYHISCKQSGAYSVGGICSDLLEHSTSAVAHLCPGMHARSLQTYTISNIIQPQELRWRANQALGRATQRRHWSMIHGYATPDGRRSSRRYEQCLIKQHFSRSIAFLPGIQLSPPAARPFGRDKVAGAVPCLPNDHTVGSTFPPRLLPRPAGAISTTWNLWLPDFDIKCMTLRNSQFEQ